MTLSLMYSPSFLSPKSSAEGFASCKKSIQKKKKTLMIEVQHLFSLDNMMPVTLIMLNSQYLRYLISSSMHENSSMLLQ